LAAGGRPGGVGLWGRGAGEHVEAEAVAAGRDGSDDAVEELPPGSFRVDRLHVDGDAVAHLRQQPFDLLDGGGIEVCTVEGLWAADGDVPARTEELPAGEVPPGRFCGGRGVASGRVRAAARPRRPARRSTPRCRCSCPARSGGVLGRASRQGAQPGQRLGGQDQPGVGDCAGVVERDSKPVRTVGGCHRNGALLGSARGLLGSASLTAQRVPFPIPPATLSSLQRWIQAELDLYPASPASRPDTAELTATAAGCLDAGRLSGRVVFPPGEGIGRTRPGAGSRPRRGRFRPQSPPRHAIPEAIPSRPPGRSMAISRPPGPRPMVPR
jgi:hypothetical protein